MGRAERRKAERRNRIENRKGKILMSREEIGEMKQKVSSNVSAYNVESLMTCFALAEHRLYGFGQKRIMRSLQYIDDLMGAIINDEVVMEDYMKELEDETGVIIKCGN